MDGENNGKPYEQMDDLGGFTTPIFGSTPISQRSKDKKVPFRRHIKLCTRKSRPVAIVGYYTCLKLTAKAPENRPSQKEISIPTIHFQVLLLMEEILHHPGMYKTL